MIIETVAVYRVKGDRKTFRTYPAAVSRLAWVLVFEKYGDVFDEDCGEVYPKTEPVFSEKCDCRAGKIYPYDPVFDDETPAPNYYLCPVHDRDNGYLRRLHDRLSRWIMYTNPQPKIAEFVAQGNEHRS